jgi:hypothetical protein
MRRAARIRLYLTVALVSACSAKGEGEAVSQNDAPEEVSTQLCAQADSCGCFDGQGMTNVEQCQTQVRANWEETVAMGQAAGLTYDGNCVGAALDDYAALGCLTELDVIEDDDSVFGCGGCKLFHGDTPEGEPCTADETLSGVGDECAQGLRCIGQRCSTPCNRAGAGESCLEMDCEDGLVCVYDNSGGNEVAACAVGAAEGESCADRFCGDGLVCSEQQTCLPLPTAGEPCVSGQCDFVDSYCEESTDGMGPGTCVALKPGGEPCSLPAECQSFECEGGSCSAEPPIACYIY